MGKKNVHKLSIDFSEESSVWIAISSPENDYRLSWAMNEYLGLHFVKSENYLSFHPKLNDFQEFSTYECITENTSCKLISNRCESGHLLEELKNIDYILVVEAAIPDVNGFIQNLKKISFVVAVFLLDKASLKGKKRLI